MYHRQGYGISFAKEVQLADNYASKGGFKVYLPDFFMGHSLRHDLLYSVENAMDGNQSWLFSRMYVLDRFIATFLHTIPC